ncbi:hypothetical protein SAMN05444007_11366 [Cribrihabitans marinus]|uniref:TolB amino-terminal domain-containing protein n=1 Tax=Cribrihabitans marinus TaxID=1227549 RepID=A0A1H7DSD8_9RHOB|nr:hypothetical protein [Cribrihabitans marinus]GGH40025.1 hypothetical protein GCM10010973_36220 [Cribrihabitans marinus]SEK04653.1 hypothetical protein SAMN05444007_11366 [Cribrihabitans marinus]
MSRAKDTSNNGAIDALTGALACDPRFEASDRLKALLTYLGKRAASGDKVTQTEIAQDVMRLGSDFDPQVDAHVRIEVGRLRKALELHHARNGQNEHTQIIIPKGSYRPEAVSFGPVVPEMALGKTACVSVFTGFECGPELPHEVAELAARELRVLCFASPLSRSGVARFPVRVAENAAEWQKMVADERSHLALHVTGYRTEAQYRVLVEVSQSDTGEIVHSQRQAFAPDFSPTRLAQKIARGTANILSDPILGAVPVLAANRFDNQALAVLLSAYRFMATQRIEQIPEVLAGLEHMARSGHAAPPVKALHAEIARVHGWLQGSDSRSDALRCLEMAENAIAEDPSDLTCRIALAYNRLNAGLIEAALHTGATTLANPAPTSLTHMTRMLVAVSDTEGQYRPLLCSSDLEDDTPFFMKEFAEIIPMIRWSEIHEAERRLAGSLFPNIFWLHVFHTAVLAEMGDLKRAARSVERIRHQLPDCRMSLKRMILGVFPRENEHAYLFRGLKDAGLRLA